MPDPDISDIRFSQPVQDVMQSLGLLSRLPVRVDAEAAAKRGADASWAWPLAGAILGLIAALTASLSLWLGLGAGIAAALVIAVQIISTGAMHEDGLADSADGLWGGYDRDRRLEIMKDSRIGTYGVLALVLALILRWAALSALLATGHVWGALIGVAALSRAPMGALMGWLPSARPSGLSRSVGQPTRDTVRFGFIAAGAVGFVFMGLAVVPVAAFIAAVAFAAGRIALDKIGGQTGDILGATQQLSEITALAVLVALWV